MMNSTEMMERFRQFSSADLFSLDSCRINQVSEVLLEFESLRIVLTRYECKVKDVEVDVEVSLPPLPKSYDMTVLQQFIDIMIEILEYLKRLRCIGFGIELVEEVGILVASGTLPTNTKENVFEVLGSLNRA